MTDNSRKCARCKGLSVGHQTKIHDPQDDNGMTDNLVFCLFFVFLLLILP